MHKGSCHCGQVRYEVDGDFDKVIECNCSHCSRKGYLLWFVPRDKLRITAGEGTLSTYKFNKHVISHQFCPQCGCAPFGLGANPKGEPTAAINVRCIEGIDLTKLNRMSYDGLSK